MPVRIASLLLASLLFTNAGHAFETSEDFWESGQAIFYVGISGSSRTGGTWNDAFKRSMDAWSNASSFRFIAVNAFQNPCINRGEGQFGDGVTGVDFSSTVCGADFGESTLAVTLTAGLCLNQQCIGGFSITDADIVFNSSEPWDVYSGPLRFDNTSDFERVALHELGHALGLKHSSANSAIMQPSISDTDTLQSDDISGANSIYGGETVVATTVDNIYGVALVSPDNSTLSGPNDNISLTGTLSSTDNQHEGKSLDIYQYTFEYDSNVDIQLNSQTFDPFLYFVRVSSTQAFIPGFTFVDDNSGSGNNARVNRAVQAGTYWIGVSSANNNAQGSYDVSITAGTTSTTPSFDTFTSIYGVDVLVNPNPNIKGSLRSSDFAFILYNAFLDIIQFDVTNASNLKIDLGSNTFDTFLFLVEIETDQSLGQLSLSDNDGGIGSNSRLETTLQPGTYWLGVTSFAPDETGDYTIAISVVLP